MYRGLVPLPCLPGPAVSDSSMASQSQIILKCSIFEAPGLPGGFYAPEIKRRLALAGKPLI